MREKIANLIRNKDCTKEAGQILKAITEEIEKGLLTDEELDAVNLSTRGSGIDLWQAIAQAQLQKVLALLK